MGKSVINTMPHKKVLLPAILNYFPQQYLIGESLKFFHKKIILDNLYISDNFIEENIFLLSEKTDAALAEYKSSIHEGTLKLMIIQYSDDDTARIAFDDVIKL
ncbi:MAG: hypothetical protein JETT_0880 [Candidatus Jettenia ecosi]|uniref:Uncharacterized protein n=1 Tax=Candidatus Jettenia ecosi TaxID=2494326 RepID=A0A533QDM4_9BACT|nr:MAG: hypothetical protein JETT_0880 [Candidatus Jettenia ecosi]